MKTALSNQLRLCNQLYKRMDDIYYRTARRLDMSEAELWIMYILREHDELLTQSDICGITYESKQTVNSALKKMEINGFIELIKNEDNMKKKFIHLTEKGLELAEKTADKILAAEENSIRAMGRDEMETLLRLYEKYIGILDKEMNDIE